MTDAGEWGKAMGGSFSETATADGNKAAAVRKAARAPESEVGTVGENREERTATYVVNVERPRETRSAGGRWRSRRKNGSPKKREVMDIRFRRESGSQTWRSTNYDGL
jgi:hypothetical protein